jgi:NADPH:quinone reductase-like Zn-dependent oxidoreductase
MQARVAIPVPQNLSLEHAGGMGVGLLTAAEGVFSCLGLPLPPSDASTPKLDPTEQPWALVLGGASSVGFNAVQLLLACGLRVVTTCSPRSSALLRDLGVRCVSYALSAQEIIAEVAQVTDKRVKFVFDAVGSNNGLMPGLLEAVGGRKQVFFTTTNAFEPLPTADGLSAKTIQLGPIGQPRPEASGLNDAISRYIPALYQLLKGGEVRAGPYQIAGNGMEGILEAWEIKTSSKVAGKVVVKIADE